MAIATSRYARLSPKLSIRFRQPRSPAEVPTNTAAASRKRSTNSRREGSDRGFMPDSLCEPSLSCASSFFQARAELLINFDLISYHQPVGLIGHAVDRHQFQQYPVGHTFVLR